MERQEGEPIFQLYPTSVFKDHNSGPSCSSFGQDQVKILQSGEGNLARPWCFSIPSHVTCQGQELEALSFPIVGAMGGGCRKVVWCFTFCINSFFFL